MEEAQLTWRTTAIDRETPNDFAFAIRFSQRGGGGGLPCGTFRGGGPEDGR